MPNKKETKLLDDPLDKLLIFMTMYQEGMHSTIRMYCTNRRDIKDENRVNGYEISKTDIEKMIISAISQNFKKYFWTLYYKKKTLNIPDYSKPHYNEYYDQRWYTSDWGGEIQEFSQEILDIFCCTYEITKERENTVGLPTIDMEITFDTKKAIKNLNNYIIDLK